MTMFNLLCSDVYLIMAGHFSATYRICLEIFSCDHWENTCQLSSIYFRDVLACILFVVTNSLERRCRKSIVANSRQKRCDVFIFYFRKLSFMFGNSFLRPTRKHLSIAVKLLWRNFSISLSFVVNNSCKRL